MSLFKKLLLSAFIVLNLGTVLFMNRPKGLIESADRPPRDQPNPTASLLVIASALDQMYAHVTGLDNVWSLYAMVARGDTWHRITAEYADGTAVLLPLPLQSERTFWQRHVVDFKEVILQSSHFLNPAAREEYTDYLRRQYPTHNGAPIRAIIWEIRWQYFLPPDDPRAQGSHLAPEVHTRTLGVYPAAACKEKGP
jgi:hypothetical protein